MSAGKGDTPRPANHAKYRTNYDLIFRKHEHPIKHSDANKSKQKRATLKARRKDCKTDR